MNERGFALFAVMTTVAVLLLLVTSYHTITRMELSSNYASISSRLGFFAAEAGLNVRAEEIRARFLGYNRPSGTSPSSSTPCESGDDGSGDFACDTLSFNDSKHDAQSYVEEDPSNPLILSIPPGERYQGLNAQEYRYTAVSKGVSPEGGVEAQLELTFKSRLVPLFQFAAFYNKDLEILPGPTMNLEGPVHTNGQLYLDAGNQLAIDGQVTAANEIFRGRKNNSSCKSKPINIKDPNSYLALINSCGSRTQVTETHELAYNGMLESQVPEVEVPSVDMLLPTPTSIYFSKADVRIIVRLDSSNVLDTTNSPTGIEVVDGSGVTSVSGTSVLNACVGSLGETSAGANDGTTVGYTQTFYNNRESAYIRMLEVDIQNLFDCMHNSSLFGSGKNLQDDSEGGLVLYFTVIGPNSAANPSNYGVRLKNANALATWSGVGGDIQGLTVVSDQAVYVQGNYNAVNKKPAAILADAFNVLSNAWGTDDTKSTSGLNSRKASHTTINTAVLAGTDTTGGIEGSGGQGGGYNGGLENYPRFHEKWSGKTLTYYGSFVSLSNSLRSNGAWVYGSPQYTAPNRDWHYDTDFNDAANLPPITPRFVYLRQQLFHRDFEQD